MLFPLRGETKRPVTCGACVIIFCCSGEGRILESFLRLAFDWVERGSDEWGA